MAAEDAAYDASFQRAGLARVFDIGKIFVDAVLIIITSQAMIDPILTAQRIGELADKTDKPLLAAWLGGHSTLTGIRILNDLGIPTYSTPKQAVRALMTWWYMPEI